MAGGSNYRTLRANNIRVDFLTLVERADYDFDYYEEVIKEFGRDKCRLVMSSTCNNRLADLFDDHCVFFRPALTPLALFSVSANDILPFEGPEAINAALSFAASLKPKRILLVGSDLGTADLKKPRSEQALAWNERVFDIEFEGNFQEIVYTTKYLLDTREMMQDLISTLEDVDTKVINASNGVLIDGAQPLKIEDYLALDDVISVSADELENVNDWWKNQSIYTLDLLKSMWSARHSCSHY